MTLDGLSESGLHPLTREAHFHIVLLGLRILRYSSNLDSPILWRFKDRLLTASLVWFSAGLKWSFGGNRLQIKAEYFLLGDLQAALEKVAHIGRDTISSRKSLQSKQDLLSILLASEQTRLIVWLYPLDSDKRAAQHAVHYPKLPTDFLVSTGLKTAWNENPAIAVQLAHRFPSPQLSGALRFYLLSFPEKVLGNCDALEMLMGPSLPPDVTFQLKVTLTFSPEHTNGCSICYTGRV
jgi:phosphatidylinositol 4-kinase